MPDYQIDPNPEWADKCTFGVLAYVSEGDRKRILAMRKSDRERAIQNIEKEVKKLRKRRF